MSHSASTAVLLGSANALIRRCRSEFRPVVTPHPCRVSVVRPGAAMLIALGVFVALVAACALTHYGFVALAHLGVGKARRRGVLWGFAVFTGVALVVLYAWGLLYVAGGV